MITLLVALLLKPFIEAVKTSEGYYDAVTCGLPTDDHMEPSNKRSSEMEHDFHLSTETTVGANDEYDYDYMSQDNMQEERDDDGDDPMQTKVMGGARASNGELPWAVFIEVPNGGGLCGGTLISKRHVLTAAHCFLQNPLTPTDRCSAEDAVPPDKVAAKGKVYVGGVCLEKSKQHKCTDADLGVEVKVKRALYGPFFEKGCKGTNDIAILELRENVPEGIHHICLPQHHNVDELHRYSTRLFSFGWGNDPSQDSSSSTGFSLVPSVYLQKIDLGSEMDEKQCKKYIPSKYPDTFCTYEHRDRNVCHGDSGGGVTAKLKGRHYIVGIVSYGTACDKLLNGRLPKAQVMTDLRYYTADIDTVIGLQAEDRERRWRRDLTKQKKP